MSVTSIKLCTFNGTDQIMAVLVQIHIKSICAKIHVKVEECTVLDSLKATPPAAAAANASTSAAITAPILGELNPPETPKLGVRYQHVRLIN